VKQTLTDIKASDKPTIMLFNKIDAYRFTEKEADDLSPATKENLSLEELEKTWMAHENLPSLFISATTKQNIDTLREFLYTEVRKIVMVRYPENQGIN
jgi:GTP-binding protein HflX